MTLTANRKCAESLRQCPLKTVHEVHYKDVPFWAQSVGCGDTCPVLGADKLKCKLLEVWEPPWVVAIVLADS